MKLIALFSLLNIVLSNGAKILVCVPTPSISHQVVFYPLINELLKRNHEIVFITTDPIHPKGKTPANLTEIDTHDASYQVWKDVNLNGDLTIGTKEDLLNQVTIIFKTIKNSFEVQMLTPEVQSLIYNKVHFDLLIVEACVKSAFSLSHVFKGPVILMSSFGSHLNNYDIIGAPKYPRLLYPYCMHQKINNMTILDKIKVLWDVYNIEAIFSRLEVEENNLVKKLFGPNIPTLEEMGNNVQMLFLNVYPIWEMNRPVPPSVVFIGGIHQKPHNALPEDLKAYLDSSERGVVYFSLGTNVSPSTLSAEKIRSIANGLAKLNYDVLVKWDYDTLPGQGNNTKVAKWLPQADILRHPNIKAFVTQGGLQSFDEALTGGVPFVGIPMLADQWYNVQVYVYLKIGVELLMEELTDEKLVIAVNTVIDDTSYRRNMISLREKIRDQPESGLARAVWWAEHVIRHKGAAHLRAPAANMPWTQFLDLQLWTAIALMVLTALAVAAIAITLMIRFVRRFFTVPKKKKKKTNFSSQIIRFFCSFPLFPKLFREEEEIVSTGSLY